MAENKEYVVQGQEDGVILISDEVIATIAAAAVLEVEGASLNSNLGSDLAGKFGVRTLGKGIKLSVEENNVSLECSIVLEYGYDVIVVAQNVQQSVKNAVESMTGFQVERVDVFVSAVTVAKKK